MIFISSLVAIVFDLPIGIFSDLYKCYIDTFIYLLQTYPLDSDQLHYVTGNYLASLPYERVKIRTNQDLIRCVSNNTDIYNVSLNLGMRNIWYILHEQQFLTLEEVQSVRNRCDLLIRYFNFRIITTVYCVAMIILLLYTYIYFFH